MLSESKQRGSQYTHSHALSEPQFQALWFDLPCIFGSSLSLVSRGYKRSLHSLIPLQIEKPAGGNPGQKQGGWGLEDSHGQKHDRETWRSDKDPGEHHRSWAGSTDHNHQPGQQDRFAPQLGRPRPPPGADSQPSTKTNERWRDDGQSRCVFMVHSRAFSRSLTHRRQVRCILLVGVLKGCCKGGAWETGIKASSRCGC